MSNSKWKIFSNFVAFSEHLNFKIWLILQNKNEIDPPILMVSLVFVTGLFLIDGSFIVQRGKYQTKNLKRPEILVTVILQYEII